MKYLKLTCLLALAFILGGCNSGLHTVRGKVAFEDGTPLDGGMVVFEMTEGGKTHQADGPIQPDGTFEMRTSQPGDGVHPGKYRVLVRPKARPTPEQKRLPPLIHPKYEQFETSGIEFVVEPKTNAFEIKVASQQPRVRSERSPFRRSLAANKIVTCPEHMLNRLWLGSFVLDDVELRRLSD